MYTNDNVKYLLSIGNLYSTDAIHAIRQDKVMDKTDKNDMIDVVMNNDFPAFCRLDTIVRDHLIDALAKEFNFLEYNDYVELSDMVLAYKKMLENVQSYLPTTAAKAMQSEIDKAMKWNTRLCYMMGKVDPSGENER